MHRLDRFKAPALAGLIFIGLLPLALWLHGDYGVTWDQALHRGYGRDVTRYVLQVAGASEATQQRLVSGPVSSNITTPDHALNHALQHGPVVEATLFGIERLLNLDDMYHVKRLRHLLCFVLFAVGVAFFFLLCRRLFCSVAAGALGAAALVLSPRIFAHAFFNTADMPFLSFYIVAIYTMVRFLERPGPWATLAHAAACVLVIDVRVAGLVVPAVTMAALVVRALGRPAPWPALRRTALPALVFAFFCAAGVVMLWPVLWSDPVGNLALALSRSTMDHRLGSELYMGSVHVSVPWHYVPVWIGITTPPAYLALMLAGAALLGAAAWRGGVRRHLAELAVVACTLIPLAAVMLLGTSLYNGWRHLYFVYPPLLVLAVGGAVRLWRLGARLGPGRGRALRVGLAATLCGVALWTGALVVRAHPQQHAYFNALVGGAGGRPRAVPGGLLRRGRHGGPALFGQPRWSRAAGRDGRRARPGRLAGSGEPAVHAPRAPPPLRGGQRPAPGRLPRHRLLPRVLWAVALAPGLPREPGGGAGGVVPAAGRGQNCFGVRATAQRG